MISAEDNVLGFSLASIRKSKQTGKLDARLFQYRADLRKVELVVSTDATFHVNPVRETPSDFANPLKLLSQSLPFSR